MDDDLTHAEERSLANELRDHEGHHKALMLASVPLAGVLGLVFGPVTAIIVFGLCLLGAGITAIRGGKSRITRIGTDGDWEEPSLSVEELERMAPAERRHHARVTGTWLIIAAIAILLVGVTGLL